jgi:hypothetical protein
MATVTAPWDGRFQFTGAEAAIASASVGLWPPPVEQVGPDRYVVRGSWPTPKPTPTFSSAVAASTSAPEAKPRSPGHALWPNLP